MFELRPLVLSCDYFSGETLFDELWVFVNPGSG
jgi:hypothetical protein